MMMKEDVKSAFRYIIVAAPTTSRLTGFISELDAVVIDLSLLFGWTGSPAHYGAVGCAISFMVSQESPHTLGPSAGDIDPSFGFEWVDDNVLKEVDPGDRLELCACALRLAMMASIGPRAIEEDKFSGWTSSIGSSAWNGALRLVLCRCVGQDLQRNCPGRVAHHSASRHATAVIKVVGSLRHVCSCIRYEDSRPTEALAPVRLNTNQRRRATRHYLISPHPSVRTALFGAFKPLRRPPFSFRASIHGRLGLKALRLAPGLIGVHPCPIREREGADDQAQHPGGEERLWPLYHRPRTAQRRPRGACVGSEGIPRNPNATATRPLLTRKHVCCRLPSFNDMALLLDVACQSNLSRPANLDRHANLAQPANLAASLAGADRAG
ncbi:hypothetical protein PybrP1_000987 [[Pythium] brassicae (nom. inval.)]|nr:hypothetical protein PybrP1_000987 [[Pythium] brassicae (nom. inval.)]